MPEIVEYGLEDGHGRILIAVDAPADTQAVTRGWAKDRAQRVADRAVDTFEATIASIKPATEALLRSFAELQTPPKEIKAEFGIGLTAEADAYVAQVGSSANFTVTLTWSPPEKR